MLEFKKIGKSNNLNSLWKQEYKDNQLSSPMPEAEEP